MYVYSTVVLPGPLVGGMLVLSGGVDSSSGGSVSFNSHAGGIRNFYPYAGKGWWILLSC